MPISLRTTFTSMESESAELVPVAEGLAMPVQSETTFEDWRGFDVTLVVGAEPARGDRMGQFVCRAVTVQQRDGGPAVTTEATRGVPIATLMRHAVLNTLLTVKRGPDGTSTSYSPFELTAETAARLRAEGPTHETLQLVANLYRIAVVLQDPPTRAVETALGLPRSTAGRWVAMARREGFLGAAEGPGKAGG